MQEETDLRPIKTLKSNYQTIRLYEGGDGLLVLTLDTFVQFKEGEDEQKYHENLVDKAIDRHKDPHDFLILGGGDGLCARNIKNKVSDAIIRLVEIDRMVIDLCNIEPRITEINKGALDRALISIADALDWVKKDKNFYDVIILDLPDATSDTLKKLYAEEFYNDTAKLLRENGVMSVQAHPDISNDVALKIEKIFGNSETIVYEMPWLTEGAVVIGIK